MAVGGGVFTTQNKVLPGAYINFIGLASAAKMGERGVAALPLELDWGPEKQIFALHSSDFYKQCANTLGYDPMAPEILLVREAMKRAKTLLLYRVNSGGAKASAQAGGLEAQAKWGGVRGNSLRVAVMVNPDSPEKMDVVTYLDGQEMDLQTVPATGGGELLKDNAFVCFRGGEQLEAAAPCPLSGGENGQVTGACYTAFLNALEAEAFNVVGYPGTDESVKSLLAAFIKRLRYEEGRKVVGVLHAFDGDDMGLIHVKNGVVLTGGTVIPGEKAVAWVTGASAGAQVNESLTNTAYDGAVDVDIKYPSYEMEEAIRAGQFVFYADNGKARVLTDINSLTTFGGGVSEDWTSNRVVRVMDGWANDVARIFGDRYLGRVTNSDTGRQLFKADLVSLAGQYQSIDAISGFLPEDITVIQGDGKRDVAVDCALNPNDSMEKLYMTVQVA